MYERRHYISKIFSHWLMPGSVNRYKIGPNWSDLDTNLQCCIVSLGHNSLLRTVHMESYCFTTNFLRGKTWHVQQIQQTLNSWLLTVEVHGKLKWHDEMPLHFISIIIISINHQFLYSKLYILWQNFNNRHYHYMWPPNGMSNCHIFIMMTSHDEINSNATVWTISRC